MELLDIRFGTVSYLQDYPREVRGSVGAFLGEGAVSCGGFDATTRRPVSNCYEYKNGGEPNGFNESATHFSIPQHFNSKGWTQITRLNIPRAFATATKVGNPQPVLDGDIDTFLESFLRWQLAASSN